MTKERRVLFIDRDGTIIVEPPEDYQVDSLDKLEFLPGVISALKRIVESGLYELVMVTNQDGLGTDSFPEDTFWPAHNKMLKILAGEGIVFDAIYIDKSFEHEKKDTRKPRTGLLTSYIEGDYDLSTSYVIGDRASDIELADNLGARGIIINATADKAVLSSSCWNEITGFVLGADRRASIKRNTKETQIEIEINIDGTGQSDIKTGLNFFDHMLEQIARHSLCDLKIAVNGDLHVDEHHTIEDTAIALGEAFKSALGDKRGINRYGFLLPMDDCLAQVAIDFSGRPWLVWDAEFKREKLGDMPTEMFEHFFKSFSDSAACNLNIKAEGTNEHHKIESIFKAMAKAIAHAVSINTRSSNSLPSTKGVL